MNRFLWIFILSSCDFVIDPPSVPVEEEDVYQYEQVPSDNRETIFTPYSSNYQYLFNDNHNKNFFVTEKGPLTKDQYSHFKSYYQENSKQDIKGTYDDYMYFDNRGDGSCGIRARFFKYMLFLQRNSQYTNFLTTITSHSHKYSSKYSEFNTDSCFIDAIDILSQFEGKSVKETIIGFNDIHFNDIVIEHFLRTYWRYSAIECFELGADHPIYGMLHTNPKTQQYFKIMIGSNGVASHKSFKYRVPVQLFLENIFSFQSSIPGDQYMIDNPCDVYGYYYDEHVDIVVDKSLLY